MKEKREVVFEESYTVQDVVDFLESDSVALGKAKDNPAWAAAEALKTGDATLACAYLEKNIASLQKGANELGKAGDKITPDLLSDLEHIKKLRNALD